MCSTNATIPTGIPVTMATASDDSMCARSSVATTATNDSMCARNSVATVMAANDDMAAPARAYLDSLGVPPGLASGFGRSISDFSLRIWIVDNSGSMQTSDGKRIVEGPNGKTGVVASSRWEELSDSLRWHAKLAAAAHAPTELRLLNTPAGRASQVVSVGHGDVDAELAAVDELVRSSPTGRTPLCAQISAVSKRIQAEAPRLRQSGQRVVVVIASDGAATDGDVAQALRPLQSLPVWVVVRLCTDSEEVVEYWNKIDEDLELDMDVLDDLAGEAQEVVSANGWLTYASQMHRLREWGCASKIFDLLDEKRLSASEMRALVEAVLGGAACDLPNPQLDWDGFENALKAVLDKTPLVWDPLRRCKQPWFSVSKLRRQYGKGGGCCVM